MPAAMRGWTESRRRLGRLLAYCRLHAARRPQRVLAQSRSDPPRHLGVQRGFTLIELVTVVVIVGVLSAYVAPRFFDNQVFSERGYADEIAAMLRYSQRIATASNCRVQITIDAAAYSAFQQNGCPANGVGTWGTPVRRADGTNLAGAPPTGVVLTPASTTIVFLGDGSVSGGATLSVAGRFAISVDASNGMVTVTP